MKKLFVAFVALSLMFSVQASAKGRFGFTGGMNFNTAKFENVSLKASAGWNAGITVFWDLPLGFSLQPALVYNQTNLDFSNTSTGIKSYKKNSAELPFSVQWGPDLLIFRPFLDFTPHVGYGISNEIKYTATSSIGNPEASGIDGTSGLNKFYWGVSVGVGLNVWKFQLLARYRWNMGALKDANLKEAVGTVGHSSKENFGGITLGLSFLF